MTDRKTNHETKKQTNTFYILLHLSNAKQASCSLCPPPAFPADALPLLPSLFFPLAHRAVRVEHESPPDGGGDKGGLQEARGVRVEVSLAPLLPDLGGAQRLHQAAVWADDDDGNDEDDDVRRVTAMAATAKRVMDINSEWLGKVTGFCREEVGMERTAAYELARRDRRE